MQINNDPDAISIKRCKVFLHKTELNINKYLPYPGTSLSNAMTQRTIGQIIKIDSVAGFKKTFPDDKMPFDRQFYIRFKLTFYSNEKKAFFGSTFLSRLVPITFNSSNQIEATDKEAIFAYFLSLENDSFECAVEVVFITSTLHQVILSEEVLGWTLMNLHEGGGIDAMKICPNFYLGSCRLLLFKDIKSMVNIPNISLYYSCGDWAHLENISFLFPHYAFAGENIEIPGLLFRYLPKKPTNEAIKLIPFTETYIKSIEIDMYYGIESNLLNQMSIYRKEREPNGNNTRPITVINRQVRCYLHNTWKCISLDKNSIIPLEQKGNYLVYQGAHLIDNYLIDEVGLCGFVLDLVFTLAVPFGDKIEEQIVTIGTSVFVPESIDNLNNFQSAYFASGPGTTLSGEEIVYIKAPPIRLSFSLSKNKDLANETFIEKKYEILNHQIESLHESMIAKSNEAILSKDQNGEIQVKEMEKQMNELVDRRNAARKEIKEIYNYSPKQSPKDEQILNNPLLMNKQFIIDEDQMPTENPNIDFNERKNQESLQKKVKDSTLEVNQMQNDNKPSVSINKQVPYNDYQYKQYEDFNDFKNRTQQQQSQQRKQDQSNNQLTQHKPIQSYDANPNLIYDMNGRDLSRKDKAELLSQGIIDIDLKEESQSCINYTFENEISPNQINFAHSFTFHFVSFKPKKQIKSYKEVPNKIQFKFSFWDFNSYTSSIASISKPSANIIPSTAPLIITRDEATLSSKTEEKEMKVSITFDPSVDNNYDYRDFINYLLLRQLFVQVYDSESQMEIGFIKIPLKPLLRQGKSSTLKQVECIIYNTTFDQCGAVQIIMRSNEMKTFREYKYDKYAFKIFNTKENVIKDKKKKVVSVTPYDMKTIAEKEKEFYTKSILAQRTQNKIEGKDGSMSSSQPGVFPEKFSPNKIRLNHELEKKVRVLRYFNKDNLSSINIPEEAIKEQKMKVEKETEFYQTLNYANQIKQLNKDDVLLQAVRENERNLMNIALVTGQPHFFNYVIYNESPREELYHLIVSNGKEKTQTINDTVTIISDASQWERIANETQLATPNDFNSISKDYYIIIKPYETIPLLVRLLSFEKIENCTYTIWIQKKKGNPLSFLTITIVNVFPVIDHIFTYNVAMNKYHHIKFINPFKFNRLKTATILENMITSDKTVNIKVDSASNDYYFKVRSLNKDSIWEMMLYLYLDNDRRVLYSTWKFEISSKEAIDVYTNVGVRLSQKLNLEPDTIPRTIQFFSSNMQRLSFPEKYSSPIVLVPRMRYDISYVLFSKTTDAEDIIINCIDISSKEVIRSWLIKNSPMKPRISQSLQIECRLNCVNVVKFDYVNPLNSWAILRFESSNKELLELVEDQISFNSEEKKLVSVNINSMNEPGTALVYVFITDVEEVFNQTILFQLNYN